MRKYLATGAFCFFSIIILSQDQSNTKFLLFKSDNESFYFDYTLTKGETVYSVSQKFKQPLTKIAQINIKKNLTALASGEAIRIPYSKDMIIHSTGSATTALVYITQPKETLYSISKRYFDVDIKSIQGLNNLENDDLDIGQELIIGYTNTLALNNESEWSEVPNIQPNDNAIRTNIQTKEEAVVTQKVNYKSYYDNEIVTKKARGKSGKKREYTIIELIEMIGEEEESGFSEKEGKEGLLIDTKKVEEVEEVIEMFSQKGLAYTKNVKMEGNDLFVLHPHAKLNSEMEITYPMLNKTVKAKVISKFPEKLYPKNISVVISPSVAAALGAKDNQFRVEMKYITN
ncbi:MAG: LysM peptidoglycan-binding domain-containing protein [Saprospiraceae bacterium]